jgi:hypothetical protein
MAEIAALTTVLKVAGTVVGVAGSIASGAAARRQANYQARQDELEAKDRLAAASRDAQHAQRMKRLQISNIRAQAAGDGFSADDATTIQNIAETEDYGGYQAEGVLWEGKRAAEALRRRAESTRKSGRAAFTSGIFDAAGIAFKGLSGIAGQTMFSQYAGGGYTPPNHISPPGTSLRGSYQGPASGGQYVPWSPGYR